VSTINGHSPNPENFGFQSPLEEPTRERSHSICNFKSQVGNSKFTLARDGMAVCLSKELAFPQRFEYGLGLVPSPRESTCVERRATLGRL
jgi:hypothetical protein